MSGAGLVQGKVALVTGGASGIGRATALLLAREGARVAVCDVDEAGVAETLEPVRRAGGDALEAVCDVRDEAAVEALFARVERELGPLSAAIHCAGVTNAASPLLDTALDEFERVLAINLHGTFLVLKHALRVMVPRGAGAIVTVSSGAGIVGTPFMAPYCASKHGVLALTKTAAMENARTGVRINAVCPGATDTPMLSSALGASPALEKLVLDSTAGGRLGEASEIAEAAVWLCSDRASFVNGESMLVDGGAVVR